MAAGTPLSAKNAKVRINGSTHYQQKWEVDPETTFEDTSNAETVGYELQTPCLSKCMVNVEGWFDSGANPYDAPLSFQTGTRLTEVKLYVSGTAGPYWYFPYLDVQSVKHIAEVKGVHKLQIRGKAYGSFTYPTGNV